MVVVKLFGIPNCHLSSVSIPLNADTAFDQILEEASQLLEYNLKDILIVGGALKKNIFILLNGKRLDELGGLNAKISAGDTIVINKLLLGG